MAKKRNGNPNNSGTFFVNTGNGSFPVGMDSQMHRDLYNSGRLMTYNPQMDEYIAPSLPEFTVSAKRNKSFLEEWGDKIVQESQGAGPAGAIFGATMNAGTSLAQLALTKLLTGKTQRPSEAMNIQNPYGAGAVDMVLDPLNVLGGFASKGTKLASLKNIGKRDLSTISDIAEALAKESAEPKNPAYIDLLSTIRKDLASQSGVPLQQKIMYFPSDLLLESKIPIRKISESPLSKTVKDLSTSYWNDPKTIEKYKNAYINSHFNDIEEYGVLGDLLLTKNVQKVERSANKAIQKIQQRATSPLWSVPKDFDYSKAGGVKLYFPDQAFITERGIPGQGLHGPQSLIQRATTGLHEHTSHQALKGKDFMPHTMARDLQDSFISRAHARAIQKNFKNDPRAPLIDDHFGYDYYTNPAEIHARILETKLHAGKFPQKADLTWDDFQKAADSRVIDENFLWFVKDKNEFVKNANKYASGLPIIPALNNKNNR